MSISLILTKRASLALHCMAPEVTLINCRVDNTPKYVCPTVIIDIARKITKFDNFKILMGNDYVMTE